MKIQLGKRGLVLFETLLLLQLFVLVLFTAHLHGITVWQHAIDSLQDQRLSYDGEQEWKGN